MLNSKLSAYWKAHIQSHFNVYFELFRFLSLKFENNEIFLLLSRTSAGSILFSTYDVNFFSISICLPALFCVHFSFNLKRFSLKFDMCMFHASQVQQCCYFQFEYLINSFNFFSLFLSPYAYIVWIDVLTKWMSFLSLAKVQEW